MKKIIRRTYSSYESFAEMQESEEELKTKKKKKYLKIAAISGTVALAGGATYYKHKNNKKIKNVVARQPQERPSAPRGFTKEQIAEIEERVRKKFKYKAPPF